MSLRPVAQSFPILDSRAHEVCRLDEAGVSCMGPLRVTGRAL